MDFDDGGSGGSTPVQDENENEMENLEKPSTPGGLIDSVQDGSAGDVEMVSRDEDADGDYVNEGGEVVREEFHEEEEEEEVEREVVEHEVDNDGDDFDADSPAAPMGSPPTPAGSGGGSPPGSPPRSRSQSPAGSVRSRSVSPMGPGPGSPPSAPGSPAGSAGSRSRSNSPQGPGPCSPLGTPGSPAGSHRSGSGSRRGSRSRSGSPASRASRSRSRSGSPARSGSGSPRSKSGSPRSRSGSRSRSRSGSRSGSARSRSGSRSGSGSPARSRSGSPARSRSGSRSRSRSGSRARSRSGSGSRAGSRRSSRSRSRSRSRSPSVAKVRRSSMSGSDKENDDDKVNETDNETPVAKKRKAHIISDDEGSEKGEKADKLIADIFGSDDEDEEFEGFGEADVEGTPKKKKSAVLSDDEGEGASGQVLEVPPAPAVDSDSDEGVVDDRKGEENNFVSDFDRMLERTREEKARQRRKRKDCDLINDNDDLVFDMIKNMKIAAEEDRGLNNKRQAATKKIKILPFILSQLKKSDLHTAFLDAGILSAITEWLAPLPDKSLPHLMIRESLLHILSQFPPSNPESLKSSGIGKAVMYLYKHPKESRKNRELAGKIINEWSRPIFNLTCNFKNLTKEERAQRDYELLPKKQRLSTEGEEVRKDMENAMAGTEGAVRPGDPGFIMRARVPAPSNKDYVNRPHNDMEYVPSKQSKKKVNKYEKHKRAFADRKKHSKAQKAVGISIEGRNMSL